MANTVLITGGSRGIGAACVRAFAACGYAVAFGYYKSRQAALELEQELPGTFSICADIGDPAQADELVRQAELRLGHIDVLINNAGIARQALITDVSNADWKEMMDVNAGGTFFCCRAALPGMIRRHFGRIINISSMWGVTGGSCEVPYSASKAAVIGLTKALAKEVGPSGITVNCIAPGVIATDMNGHLDEEALQALKDETPLQAIGSADDVAQCALYLAGAAFVTGQVVGVDGGMAI